MMLIAYALCLFSHYALCLF